MNRKIIALSTLVFFSFALSACTTQKTTSSQNTSPSPALPPAEVTQTAADEQYQQQVSQLQTDTSVSSDDKALLSALSQDSDNDFSSELSSLEKDLQ